MIQARWQVSAEEVKQHYEDLDPLYRKLWGRHLHHGLWVSGREDQEKAVKQLVEKVASFGHILPGERICDIGCGYGATALELAETYGAEVTGFTLTPAQFQEALKLRPERGTLRFELRNWLENGLEAESFHRAIAIESSEHAADRDRFFREAYRVLRPGGTFTLCSWVAGEAPSSWEKSFFLRPICEEGRLPSLDAIPELRARLRRAEFDLLHEEDLSRMVRKTWRLVLTRMLRLLLREPRALWQAASGPSGEFALTPFRMWGAYLTGSLKYVILTGRKPGGRVLPFQQAQPKQHGG